MFDMFFPDARAASAYAVDYEKLYRKGFRGLIFDIDNTLVPHGAPANARAEALFDRLKKIGFKCCLISNNHADRVEMFDQNIQINYVCDAHKPSPKNYVRAMEILGTNRKNTIFIGDQLFTDVWGAKRAGIPNVLVGPISPRSERSQIQILLKRQLEKIVLFFYRRKRRKARSGTASADAKKG